MKDIARLQFANNDAVGMVRSLHALERMVQVRVKFLPDRFDALDAFLGKNVPKLAASQFKALHVFGRSSTRIGCEREIKRIKHGEKAFQQLLEAAAALMMAFFLDAPAIVFIIGLAADQRVHQLLLFNEKLLNLVGELQIGRAGRIGDGGIRNGGGSGSSLGVPHGLVFFVTHESFDSSEGSEKNWAMKATAVMTRS